MPDSSESLFDDVCKHVRQTGLLATTGAVLDWDERTKMSSANAEYRAEQTTLLSGLTHQRWTDEAFVGKVAELAAGPMAADAESDRAVTIRRIKRQVDKKTKLPRSLVEELTRTAVLGQSAWEKARPENNFAAFPAVACADIRAQAAAGRRPGLQDMPLRCTAGRLRAGGSHRECSPRACRLAREARAAGVGHRRKQAPPGRFAPRPRVSRGRAGVVRQGGGRRDRF